MVFLTLTRKVNKAIAPFLLRNGIALRYALGRGVVSDNATLDAILMINLAQRLVSLEVHDDCMKAVRDSRRVQSALDEWAETTFDGIFGKSEEEERRKKMSDSELRVYILEQYLRPALLKNETWSDVVKWQFHTRLLKWARAEFLIAKHGPAVQEAVIAYPKLRYSPQFAIQPMRRGVLKLVHGSEIEDTTNKSALPPSSYLEKAFDMEDWNKTKNPSGDVDYLNQLASKLGGDIVELRGGSLRFASIPPDADLSGYSLEDILEIAGGRIATSGPLNALCEERDVYQVWTKEYVDLLADYLMKRTNAFHGETVILDVGAGDGLLSKNLRIAISEQLRSRSSSARGAAAKRRNPSKGKERRRSTSEQEQQQQRKVPSIVAVDDGSWRILQKADVEKMNVEDALKQYSNDDENTQQLIVLCSWMPMGVDWSSLFRKHNAAEYILIGECDNGGCGDNWETWGNRAFLLDIEQEVAELLVEEEHTVQSDQADVPPYEVDGYRRIDIDDLVPFQFSRFDTSMSRNGKTVTFRRN